MTDTAIEISVVIPAYNEQWRLSSTLIDIVDYFEKRTCPYEIIVVDDGSLDSTAGVVRKFERICPKITLLQSERNFGKGHAVRAGMLKARGSKILFSDADGATAIKEIERLERKLQEGYDIAIGSRALASLETTVVTSWYRKYPGRIFNGVVNFLVIPQIADTQCGFKMFTYKAAQFIFPKQCSHGFSFDVEILHIARKAGLKIAETAVNWVNVPGSKVNLFTDSLRMFRDVVLFKFRHRNITPQSYESFVPVSIS